MATTKMIKTKDKKSKKEPVQVNIVERSDPSEDYKRPELLQQAIQEVEAEVAAQASESESEESSSDSDEDDEARLLTPALDSDILRTIAAIRTKDPRVYEQSHHFFDEAQPTVTTKKAKEKKMTLKDYERDILLEHGGFVNEADNQPVMTHRQEQEELKNAFKAALEESSDDDDDDDDDDLLTEKKKSSKELEAEEEDYREFLLQQMKKDEHSKEAFDEWSNYKSNPNINEEDAFLMDYVLNRGWVDQENESKVDEALEKEEEFLDDVDRFESKYNYRFEEEGAGQIVTYPRDIEGSVRRKQSKRARQRERQKAKKLEMKQQAEADIKHQKNLKMQAIRDKLKEINDVTGVKTLGLDEFGLDDDDEFDPAQHDADMEAMYDDAFYAEQEQGQEEEGEQIEKPVWDDDIDTTAYEDVDAERKVAKSKQELKQLVDEYYKLNYEDVVGGDVFTRFKYVNTEPEDFGLTNEEILLADDAELNKYVTIKALAPYRSPTDKKADKDKFKKTKKKKSKELEKHIKKAKKTVEKELALLQSNKRKADATDQKKKKKKVRFTD